MIGGSFQCFPDHFPILKEHIAMFTFRFRDRHGTRIQVQISIPERFPRRDMRMAVEENVSRLERRELVHMKVMAMSSVDQAVCRRKYRVIRKDRKLQHHLVNLRIAVSADTEDFRFPLI